MADMTIDEFCDKHGACDEGREWALANCSSMQDAWQKLPFGFMFWVAVRPGVLSDKELRLLAVFCARAVEHRLTDERWKKAIDVAERFAYGAATEDELAVAGEAAWKAIISVEGAEAREAEWVAMWTTLSVAREAVDAIVKTMTASAWWPAEVIKVEDFCAYLRANTSPCFEAVWLPDNYQPE